MKLIARQKLWLTFVVIVNFVLWIVPSDVIEQIARDRHTMLGRYSRQHMTAILIVLMISAVSFYIDWSVGAKYKRRWFQVLAILLVLLPTLAVVDLVLRGREQAHYVRDTLAYHRPAHFVISENAEDLPAAVRAEIGDAVYRDRPEAFRTYPHAPEGYPPIPITYRGDKRGFRNPTDLDHYDVVVLGDSFAEGSNISDEHPWPRKLEQTSGWSVCNLGMSGYAPLHYLASLKEYGLGVRPGVVVCMIYEGNDFRSAKSDRKTLRPSFSNRMKRYFKQSPILSTLDGLVIKIFGPLGAKGDVRGIGILSWLPLSIPQGPEAKHYTFAPKQVLTLLKTREEFSADRHWRNSRGILEEMNDLCRANGARLVVAFAPLKAHVLLPLVLDDLPAEKVHAFCALREDELPDPPALMERLRGAMDGRESVVRQWCEANDVTFVSLTRALRDSAAAGQQVYFTYDQHWTPLGHEVVAGAVWRRLRESAVDRPVPNATPATQAKSP